MNNLNTIHHFFLEITNILLSGYLTAERTVNNAIRHKRRAIERKCMQTSENKKALKEVAVPIGQVTRTPKSRILKYYITSGARKE